MNKFNLQAMSWNLYTLHSIRLKCDVLHATGNPKKQTTNADSLDLQLATLEELCFASGFLDAFKKIIMTRAHLMSPSQTLADPNALSIELRNVIESVLQDASKPVFLQVREERASDIDDSLILGESVLTAFPEATLDLREAANCLAAECNTAAVFHLMRVCEWGLRAMCSHMGVLRVKRTSRAGSVKYTPISHEDWETMLAQVSLRVDAKVGAMRRGPKKQKAQEFYYPALQDIRGIKDAWRNHLMHTRAEYTSKDADAVLDHVKRLMNLLADNKIT